MEQTIKELGIYISDGNYSSKYPRSEEFVEEGVPFIRGNNMVDYDITDEEMYYITPEKHALLLKGHIKAGDVLITTRGNIGQVAIVPKRHENSNINAQIVLLRTDPEKLYNRYLLWALQSNRSKEQYLALQTGTALKQLPVGKLEQLSIKITNINMQHGIADILDKVYAVIRLRRKELQLFDDLIKARFVEMFGDMYLNSKGWPEAKLESMADVVSGITKGRKTKAEDLTEVPYMAVSNVKDGYIDWTTMKTIEATQQEIEKYRLLADDVLMTEGGDPDKVGRGAIIKEPLENCIHQNHIFRVRLDESMMRPEFFAEYLQHQRSKRYFLRCAKQTTGIASINMTQLRALPVLMPPLSRQEEFVLFKAQVNKSKVAVQRALDETQLLFDSLMQKYFG